MPMKKEDVVSAGIMTIVSMLVLIGFTVAWYTGVFDLATIGGMQLKAAEMNSVKVALTWDGPDIAEMDENSKYADIGLQDMMNVTVDKLAPGQFGKVTFFLTPSDVGIEYCEIIPQVWICQKEGEWYPGEEGTQSSPVMEELYEITQRHFVFFEDEAMENKLEASKLVVWTEEDGMATKEVTIYWQWFYEYPFTDAEKESLSDMQKRAFIDTYDAEDTRIGNNITDMKFHFTFSAQ